MRESNDPIKSLEDSVLNHAQHVVPDLAHEIKSSPDKDVTVHVKCSQEFHALLKKESEYTGLSLPHILRQYSAEFIRLRNDALTISADVNTNGKGSIIHNMLLDFEKNLVRTVEVVDSDVAKLSRKLARTEKMIELFVFLYLLHTPQIPDEFQDGHAVSGSERYKKWLEKVNSALAGGANNG